ncbi:uncharacterized protein LOC129597708 isoform X2 [Paramacrobiotus metropolitanus]|nr:uncharacterized protein LOC129597708 isoform X2 [Paramacrobiotus metropolitanus]XP_055351355.1 uncharacterized protein LOC129597708 isoform X2 [Paramacrobiotus metropolitanus]XP_055351363.1 uncharacterized protein LOC129597708 isoform X2 [Paramacrobiotus metropolitanus]
MMFAGVIAGLLAIASYVAANPVALDTCDASTFAPCGMTMQTYAMGPEGHDYLAKLQAGMDVTEPQLRSLCRVTKEALACVKIALGQCVPRDVTDFHEFTATVVRLMDVCDRPDLYSKFNTLMQCGKTLNQTSGSKARACGTLSFRLGLEKEDNWAGWRNGKIFKQICCSIKSHKTCTGTEVADKCGRETQQISDEQTHAIEEAFKCNGPRGQNCPLLPPPSADDEKPFPVPSMANMLAYRYWS